jgi:uncharacterized membrane protein
MHKLYTYGAVLAVMLLLDVLWLGVVARQLYLQHLGAWMRATPLLPAAAAFYALFALGLLIFAVLPQAATAGVWKAAAMGALFGFVAYATYDLTNLATLKGWPLGLSLLDMAWGSVVSAASAAAGKWMFDSLQPP